MLNDKELEHFFKTGKTEIPDNGFSKKVIKRLPEKTGIFPQIIIACFAVAGAVAAVAIQGLPFFTESLEQMIMTVSQAETSPFSALIPYSASLLILGSVGYAFYRSCKI
ncbi:MAG: DUF5056 domain-containing protein [Tannerella sp.]|jgi:hypothetical protein|nr:DUF5056 domain-containing protein [Tannerella sp.]